MPLDFLDKGEYGVTLGKSFDKDLRNTSRQYLAIKKNKGSQLSGYSKHAALEKERESDKYNLEMKGSDDQNVAFDADLEPEEYQCVVIYNHDTKSFRIERIGAVISLSRKNTEDIEEGAIVESPIVDRRKENEQTIVPTTDESDDFDFDITKDMDEILGDDEEEDEEEDVEMTEVPIETSINNGNSNSNNSNNNNNNNNSSESESEEDTFEEISTIPIALPPSYSSHGESVSPMSLPVTPSLPQVVASPSLPTNLQLPGTPIASSSSAAATTPTSSNNTNNTNNTNGSAPTKKRKFKMASAPIRHPGTLSPLPPVPTPPPVSRVDPKKYKSEDDDGSSSGSEESSSGSESGSTESGSSGSESESSSDDDDFESLAQDISLSLSNDGPSVPPSPQHAPSSLNTNGMSAPSPSTYGRSPYSSVNTPTPTRNASGNTGAGPMSLRALFNEQHDEEEESLSDSSSDNN